MENLFIMQKILCFILLEAVLIGGSMAAAKRFSRQTRREEGEYRVVFNRRATKYGVKIAADAVFSNL